MGESVDIKARQELNTPATWDAGEMVFVRRADGTAAMYVTSASGVPHAVTGGDTAAALYADGTGGTLTLYREVADTPATALARSGTPVNTPVIPANVLNATMFFRVLASTPITGLQLGGLTLSNGPVQAFITQHASDAPRTFQGQVAESGTLTPQSGGHHATFAGGVTLQPNTLYGLRLGNSQSGVAPQVQLASTATHTGQGWSGLVLDPYLRWYTGPTTMGQASYATAAETPAFDVLFEVPVTATPDEVLMSVQAGNGLTGAIDPVTKRLTIALPAGQLSGMVLRATGPDPDDVGWAYLTVAGRDTAGTTSNLNVGSGASLTLGNSHVPAQVARVTTTAAADVCLYVTAADRDADYARLQGTPNAAPAVPVIGQWRTSDTVPSVAGEARGVNSGTVYATVINRGAASAAITLTLTLEDR